MLVIDLMPPNKWGADNLSDFFDASSSNLKLAFEDETIKELVFVLVSTDQGYSDLYRQVKNTEQAVPGFLLGRSHSAYRTSAKLSLAGHSIESFAVARSCLEFAAYAFYISQDDTLPSLWFDRHISGAKKRKHKDRFTFGNAMRKLKKKDEALTKAMRNICDVCIDLGAHPNPRSVLYTVDRERVKGQIHKMHGPAAHLTDFDAEIFKISVRNSAIAGYLALKTLRTTWAYLLEEDGPFSTIENIHKKWGTINWLDKAARF
jgi:hypothetical protein